MTITIFTPTYNRADRLYRVYDSLTKQNCYDFEWLIIDDGSSDNTEEVVSSFVKDTEIKVRYIKKENGGKHTAHNAAVDSAQGRYFMCLDSDDYLAEGSIEKLLNVLNRCSENEGVISYKCDISGKLLSDKFPNTEAVSNTYELSQKYGCYGEFTLLYPTELLRKNKFPVFENERFITECVLYDRLDNNMILLPEIIEICEYQQEGLSNNLNSVMQKNPAGYCLYFTQRIDMQNSLKNRIITAGKYNCFCILAGKNKSDYEGKYKKTVIFCKPIGILFWLYYKLLRGF